MQTLCIAGIDVLCFYDSGANNNLVASQVAMEAGFRLLSKNTIRFSVAGGGHVDSECGQYAAVLGPDIKGDYHDIECQGVETITTLFPRFDLEPLHEMTSRAIGGHPTLPPHIGGSEVKMLIGIRSTQLAPRLVVMLPGGLCVYKSVFVDIWRSEYCFGGPHEIFTAAYERARSGWSAEVAQIVFTEMAEAYLRGPRTFLSEEQYLGHKSCEAELAVATTFTVSTEAEEESFTQEEQELANEVCPPPDSGEGTADPFPAYLCCNKCDNIALCCMKAQPPLSELKELVDERDLPDETVPVATSAPMEVVRVGVARNHPAVDRLVYPERVLDHPSLLHTPASLQVAQSSPPTAITQLVAVPVATSTPMEVVRVGVARNHPAVDHLVYPERVLDHPSLLHTPASLQVAQSSPPTAITPLVASLETLVPAKDDAKIHSRMVIEENVLGVKKPPDPSGPSTALKEETMFQENEEQDLLPPLQHLLDPGPHDGKSQATVKTTSKKKRAQSTTDDRSEPPLVRGARQGIGRRTPTFTTETIPFKDSWLPKWTRPKNLGWGRARKRKKTKMDDAYKIRHWLNETCSSFRTRSRIRVGELRSVRQLAIVVAVEELLTDSQRAAASGN
jgi:hypothetical protein